MKIYNFDTNELVWEGDEKNVPGIVDGRLVLFNEKEALLNDIELRINPHHFARCE